MNSKLLAVVAAVGVACAYTPVQADDLSITTGNSLKSWCDADGDDDTETTIMMSLCRGYISGSFEAVWSMSILSGNGSQCDMAAVTDEQISDIVLTYIKSNPSERHKPAFLSVLASMKEAFPDCFGA